MIEGCPTPSEDCPYYESKPPKKLKPQEHGCYSDVDHYWWPARDYRTPMEKEFRDLPQFLTQTCRWAHDERHIYDAAPKKPDLVFMLECLKKAVEE